MSAHVIGWLYTAAPDDLTGTQMAIAQCLANHAQDDGRNAWPSISTIVQETRFSERTVRQALRSLEGKGVIAVEHPANHRRPTTYCFPDYIVTRATPLDLPRGAGSAAQEHARGAPRAAQEHSWEACGAVWGGIWCISGGT